MSKDQVRFGLSSYIIEKEKLVKILGKSPHINTT